jgi:RNA polymerase sigma-70 factor (ECF subfamily)
MSAVDATVSPRERELLAAARRGDEGAYARLIAPYERELHAHCYRMLGSLHDAEDALQEALLRAWRGLPRFEGRASLRSWLYRLATNTSLDAIGRRKRRVLPMDYGPSADPHGDPDWPLVESVWLDPYPDSQLGLRDGYASPAARYEQREGVELAFIAALQLLPARQRAVLILREVLGFSAAEVADTLETTVAAVNSALQRARKTVDDHLPDESQQATLRTLGDEAVRELVERYMAAWERGDADAVVALLAEDAAFSMPPQAVWFRGRSAIRTFLPTGPLRDRRRFVRIPSASGQVAFATYRWLPDEGGWIANAVHVLTLRGTEIADVTCFLDPETHAAFGVPRTLPDAPPAPRSA